MTVPGIVASDNPFPSVLLVEGTTPATPSSGRQRLFVDTADGLLKLVDDAGAVTSIGGSAATHIADTSAAHVAASIGFTPNGSIAATDVQAAIQEVRDEGGAAAFTEQCSVFGAATSQSNGAEAAVPCASENYDPTGMHSTSSNTSRITIATTGKYHVDAILTFAANATHARICELRVNGTQVAADVRQAVSESGFETYTAVSVDLALTAGQYVEIYAYQSSGGALNATVQVFSVHRIA